jgi:hypothetical protein
VLLNYTFLRGYAKNPIIALHTHLAVMRRNDFPNRKEPIASAMHQGGKHGMVGDSIVEVLMQKGEGENRWRAPRAH